MAAVRLVESLLTGDYSAPGRSRTASPLDNQEGVFIEIAEGDLIKVLIVYNNLRNFLSNSRGTFIPGGTLASLLTQSQGPSD